MKQNPSDEMLASDERLRTVVARVLDRAAAKGASAAEAGANLDTGLSVNVRLGEVETIEYQRDRGLGVTVYFGNCKGSASSADLSEAAIVETVDKACSIASFTAADDCAGLADAELMADAVPELDLYHPWELTPDAAIEQAQRCEAAALDLDQRLNNSEGSSVATHANLHVYGKSHGFLGAYPSTSHSVSCAVLGQDENGMQRDYWYTSARDFAELRPAEEVGREAGERALARLGSRQVDTCRVPVVFPPELARGLVGHFVSAIRGASQYRRASFLLEAAGNRIFPAFMSMTEYPHLQRAMGSAPFDGEGVATADRVLVDEGVLTGYVLSSYSARKLGLQTTGNAGGVHNLTVTGGDEDLRSVIAGIDKGLLLRELIGQGVNGVTGDYSRGAAGFWIENGEIQFPVHEITIAGNLLDMFQNIEVAGADLDCRGGIRCGSILVGEMTLAGQ
jgi:PmbA protein